MEEADNLTDEMREQMELRCQQHFPQARACGRATRMP